MKKSSPSIASAVVITLAALATGNVFAQSVVSHNSATAPKSRAQVIVELRAAQANAEYAALSGGDYHDAFRSHAAQLVKIRAEVLTELAAARASGEYSALSGGDYSDAFRSHAGQLVKTRAEVRAELAAARASGEYLTLTSGDYRDAFLAPVRAGKNT